MRATLLSSLIVLCGCGGLVQVQVEVQRLCVTRAEALSIPALPAGGAVSVSGAISAPANGGMEVELRFDSLELRNLRGAQDFAFLEDAELRSQTGATLSQLERSRAGDAPAVRLEALPGAAAPAADRLDYLLSVSVSAVSAPVSADVEVCAQLNAKYTAL